MLEEKTEIVDIEPVVKQEEPAGVYDDEADDARTAELKEAKRQAMQEVKNEKYKAKLMVRQARLKAKIADLNAAVYDIEKELESIAEELKELNG